MHPKCTLFQCNIFIELLKIQTDKEEQGVKIQTDKEEQGVKKEIKEEALVAKRKVLLYF